MLILKVIILNIISFVFLPIFFSKFVSCSGSIATNILQIQDKSKPVIFHTYLKLTKKPCHVLKAYKFLFYFSLVTNVIFEMVL